MKLIYDARWLPVNDKYDGVGRYTYELAHALAAQTADITWLVCDARQLDKLPTGSHLMANQPTDALKELFRLPRQLNQAAPDVVYSPFYLMGTWGRKYRLVLTIHDMIYFHYSTPPQWLPLPARIFWQLWHLSKAPTRWQLNSADVVATVSDTAKDEIIKEKLTKRPVVTVLNAPAEAFAATVSEPSAFPAAASQERPLNQMAASGGERAVAANVSDHFQSNDIVYMGAFTPYKNVELLIDSLAALPGVTLHLLSRITPGRRRELEQRAQQKAVGNYVVFHDGVSDDEYHELLANSRCLVTASRLEGFGLPLVEAQAAGVPVACADTPIFREVAGDAAVFFDPNSATDCAAAIRSLSDKKTSQKLIAAGHQNITRFSWQKSAKTALAAIEKRV